MRWSPEPTSWSPVAGWAAARLLGAAYFDGLTRDGRAPLPVPLAVGPHRSLPATPRALPHNHVLLPRDRARRYGIPTVIAQMAAALLLADAAQVRLRARLSPVEVDVRLI